jgi:hypothetical protein
VDEVTDVPSRKVLPVFAYLDASGISFYASIFSSIDAFYRNDEGAYDNNYEPSAYGVW